MKFSFSDELAKADDYFKLKEKSNVIRIASEFLLYKSTYKDKPTKKFVGYIIDRRDGVVKPAFLAKKIVEKIESLQLSDEYKFEGVPMPYDIDIVAKNAGTIDADYNVIPRIPAALTEAELKAISDAGTAEDLILKLQTQQSQYENENQVAPNN